MTNTRPTTWRTSSRSANNAGQNCVEAGACSCHGIAIRDSKAPSLGTLAFTPDEWTALLSAVKSDSLG